MFIVSFAVRLADISDSIVAGYNIRLFITGGRRRSKIDDGTHKARVIVGKRGGFKLVDQYSSVLLDRYRD